LTEGQDDFMILACDGVSGWVGREWFAHSYLCLYY
jgi:serine/threonine protein phosphatase PrpC